VDDLNKRALDGFQKLRVHPGVVVGIGTDEGLFHLRGERALIALERKHIVALLREDLLGDLGLTAHRVDGDDAALEMQQSQQLRDGRDLVGLRLGRHLPEHDAVGRRPGAHQMQRAETGVAIMGAAPRLVVDGDDPRVMPRVLRRKKPPRSGSVQLALYRSRASFRFAARRTY